MKALHRQLNILVAGLLLMVLSAPCYAMMQPESVPVSSMSELLERYHSGDSVGVLREYVSTGMLTCTGETVLDGTVGRVDFVALQGIRIPNGAVLTLDNPNLVVMGSPPCITVEAGGTLRILCWNERMTDGSMPTADMIRVETGGTLQVADGLTVPADMVTVEEDTPPNTVLPPSYRPEPAPKPEQIPIEALHESTLQVESVTGKSSVEVVLPNTVQVRLSREAGDLAALAVQWDLSSVAFDTPGTYTVYGDFIPDGLIFKGVSNPKGLRPVVSLTILASNPVWDVVWGIAEPVSDGLGLVRLAFSPLPEDVEHLYLQRSTDGVRWSRCAGQNRPPDTDLLSDVTKGSGMSFLTSRQRMEPTGFYLRLEVVGSPREGTSNITYVPAVADGADGGSEGNRGGIQGTFDREGQKKPPEIPTAVETAKEIESPQKELPEQVESNKSETEEVQPEQEVGLSGKISSSGWSGYDNKLGEKIGPPITQPLVRHEGDSTQETVPEVTQQSTEVAVVPEEMDTSQPTPDSDPPAMAQPLTVENTSSAPQDDGDTNGVVAAATLAVCLLGAAGLHLLHKRSLTRKP